MYYYYNFTVNMMYFVFSYSETYWFNLSSPDVSKYINSLFSLTFDLHNDLFNSFTRYTTFKSMNLHIFAIEKI